MSTLTKSPVRVARDALAIGERCLRSYSHRYSPQKFTQPQLFACLVVKTFFKTDYRGLSALLADLGELRQALGLPSAPHFTTLQKASARLLQTPRTQKLFRAAVRRFFGRRRRVKRAAFDSTGMECGSRSHYFVRRRHAALNGWQTVAYSRYAKLEVAVDCESHVILGVLVGRGPRVDVDRFVPLLNATLLTVRPEIVVADAGYDSEGNHRYAREEQGIASFMPATHGRPTVKPPSGRHRRRMRRNLDKNYGGYGQRWQVEAFFSMLKRRLGATVHGRSYWSQCRELMLLAITFNIMLC